LRPNQLGDVQLRGKGRKIRRCPLWPATVNALLTLVHNRSPDEPVFLNRLGDAITRHGIHWMLCNHVRAASVSHPSLLRRPISPHTIRHTTATHLLRAGVDINTIRAWLGHVSIDTTNIYAEVDLHRKAEVLATPTTSAQHLPPTTSPGKTTRPCSPSSAPSNSYVVYAGLRPAPPEAMSPLRNITANTT
jgi:integrase/recombinase XerD